jgi:hypothetical protein
MQHNFHSVVNRFPLQLVGFEPRVQVGPFKSERPIIDPRVGDPLIPAKIPELTLGEAALSSGSVAVRWRRAFSIGSNGRSAGAIGRYIAGSMAASSRWCAFVGILYGDVGIRSI